MSRADNREIELKLGLLEPCDDLGEILGELGEVTPQGRDFLENVYFDTPERALFALKAGLRIRRGRDFCEQTLKMRGTALGGVHSRREFNLPLDRDAKVPDLSAFPAEAWSDGADPSALQDKLTAQCAINFNRETWNLEYKECLFEIAVDSGTIIAGRVKAPIQELEIELKEAPASADKAGLITLFDELTRALGEEGVKLTLEPFSKMHRAALLMDFDERNVIELPINPAAELSVSLRENLKTFENLLGLYLAKLNPLYLGYLAYTLKSLKRGWHCLTEAAEHDENVNFSQCFKDLKQGSVFLDPCVDKLAAFLKKTERTLLPEIWSGQEPDLNAAALKVRRRVYKTEAYCLPLHLRALLLRYESVKHVNQKA